MALKSRLTILEYKERRMLPAVFLNRWMFLITVEINFVVNVWKLSDELFAYEQAVAFKCQFLGIGYTIIIR